MPATHTTATDQQIIDAKGWREFSDDVVDDKVFRRLGEAVAKGRDLTLGLYATCKVLDRAEATFDLLAGDDDDFRRELLDTPEYKALHELLLAWAARLRTTFGGNSTGEAPSPGELDAVLDRTLEAAREAS